MLRNLTKIAFQEFQLFTAEELLPLSTNPHPTLMCSASYPAGEARKRRHTEGNAEDQEKRAGHLQHPGL